MSDLNNVTLTGRLTADAESKTMQSGNTLVTFSIANNTGFGQYECTNFFKVNAWGKQAQSVLQYLTKGKQVGISGVMENKKWTDNNGVTHDSWTVTTQAAITLLSSPQGQGAGQNYHPAEEESAAPVF